MAPNVGDDFVFGTPPTGGDTALGLVNFSMFPHLDHEDMPGHSMANAEKWASSLSVPGYAIDDQPPSKWSTAPSKSSPRGTGNSLPPSTERLSGFTSDVRP